MRTKKTKIIVTLGPATKTEQQLRQVKDKGVDFVRVNMSHSSIEDFEELLELAQHVGLSFIIDTEGSQIRTGPNRDGKVSFHENDVIKIHSGPILGDSENMALRPGSVVRHLEAGDLIHVDFDTLTLRVSDVSTASDGFVTATAITGGDVGSKKAVIIDPAIERQYPVPPLSDIDLRSIEIGLREGIDHIAVSFVRDGASVDEVRRVTQNKMRIVSKIECISALANLDEILEKSDAVLIDRGDLSKEIPLERIPFTQKIIMHKARRHGTEVYVATNLLETMIDERKPTRAEVQDVVNTILDGAAGLTLAAETAVGAYPIQCINMLNKLIWHTEQMRGANGSQSTTVADGLIQNLEANNYLVNHHESSALVPPHGGQLVNRTMADPPNTQDLGDIPKICLDVDRQMDVEQIAFGTYSPLEGFVGQEDLQTILEDMRLANGTVWPIPIFLDVPRAIADRTSPGDPVGLTDQHGNVMAILHVSEAYEVDKEEVASKMYGTTCDEHPGVAMIRATHPVWLAGKIDLLRRRESETREYELTPRQLRKLFEERGWIKVLGFHTRNVIHRGHEFVQLKAMEDEHCDGLLVHPVIGKKKIGDFHAAYIIKSYQTMIQRFYPKNKIVFATFPTFSRYAGPREALFTALCRKNFGCSHFVVGRSHTGVGDYYDPDASHRIFDQFDDLGIKAVKFNEVAYSSRQEKYVVYEDGGSVDSADDRLSISGTEARSLFERGEVPPSWFMRPEISQFIVEAVQRGEKVFVESE